MNFRSLTAFSASSFLSFGLGWYIQITSFIFDADMKNRLSGSTSGYDVYVSWNGDSRKAAQGADSLLFGAERRKWPRHLGVGAIASQSARIHGRRPCIEVRHSDIFFNLPMLQFASMLFYQLESLRPQYYHSHLVNKGKPEQADCAGC